MSSAVRHVVDSVDEASGVPKESIYGEGDGSSDLIKSCRRSTIRLMLP